MATVFGEAMKRSRARLALLLLAGLATEPPAKWDRTDHVSPCPQSASAAMQARADHLSGRVLARPSEHV